MLHSFWNHPISSVTQKSNDMEKIFIDTENEHFVIHLNVDETILKGEVYPIQEYNEKDWGYQSLHNGSHLDNTEGSRCFFDFRFCWRGVWEGRIYFKDQEYWSEELGTIKELWDKIEVIMKERIKKDNPQWTYDD